MQTGRQYSVTIQMTHQEYDALLHLSGVLDLTKEKVLIQALRSFQRSLAKMPNLPKMLPLPENICAYCQVNPVADGYYLACEHCLHRNEMRRDERRI